jgi:hypothetical protein
MVSVVQIIKCEMVGSLLNNKLDRMCEELVLV